jgi:hypothetical protein
MLPDVDGLFTLVRQLARREAVTEVAAPKWLVQRHGLGPLTARAGGPGYRDELARASLQWARLAEELPAVIEGLRNGGVRVAPIKGVAYATSLYDTPAERPMNDVDLLVPPDQIPTAEATLARLGFQQGRYAALHHARPWLRGDLVIDLHRNIIGPGRSRIDLATVWSRTTSGWPSGAERLQPDHGLVFHLVHLARNRLNLPLINVIDAARLLEHASSQRALELANTWGLGRSTSLAFRFVRSILEGDSPRPAGWLGPTRDEVVAVDAPGALRKLAFDIATAGSLPQLAARSLHYGYNRALELLARRKFGSKV